MLLLPLVLSAIAANALHGAHTYFSQQTFFALHMLAVLIIYFFKFCIVNFHHNVETKTIIFFLV